MMNKESGFCDVGGSAGGSGEVAGNFWFAAVWDGLRFASAD
jgi:hypothetical protein